MIRSLIFLTEKSLKNFGKCIKRCERFREMEYNDNITKILGDDKQ